MTYQQEFASWFAPKHTTPTAETPQRGSKAPSSPKLALEDGQATIIAFLRHCGCPFAEKTFLNLREIAKEHKTLSFIAVSHSDQAATDTWLASLPQAGSEPSNLRVVVDAECENYAQWGLGVSGFAHAISPWSLWEVWKLGSKEGIWNRPTESGSRWQTSGTFAVDGQGIVKWGGAAKRADDVPDLEAAVRALEEESEEKGTAMWSK